MKKRISSIVAIILIAVLCLSTVSSAASDADAKALKSFTLNDFGIMTLEYATGSAAGYKLTYPCGTVMTEYESYIMGAVALGYDTSAVEGKIASSQRSDGKFSDYTGGKGDELVNSHIWGVISLYSAGNDSYDKAKALSWLLSVQNKDGGFPIYKGSSSDLDMTYMAIAAMKLLGKTGASAEIKSAYEYANSVKASRKSCESTSWEIIAKDMTGNADKAVLSELSKYRLSNGTYKHLLTAKTGNYIATWHGILAKTSNAKTGNVFSHLRSKSLSQKGSGK